MEPEAFKMNPGCGQEKRVRGLEAWGIGSRVAHSVLGGPWEQGQIPATLRVEGQADESGRQAPQGRTPGAVGS